MFAADENIISGGTEWEKQSSRGKFDKSCRKTPDENGLVCTRLLSFVSAKEHGRRGRRLVDVAVRDRFLRDLLYSFRRQHITRDHSEYLLVSQELKYNSCYAWLCAVGSWA